MRQQGLELEKARFSALGLGTAEEFLRNATLMTSDAIMKQTGAVTALTQAAKTGQNQFDAWKTALRETIRALLISSSDLGRDVTEVVRQAQTELLSTNLFEGGERFAGVEDFLSNLGSAQNIFFGNEAEKLRHSEELYGDRTNGINTSAEAAIKGLSVFRINTYLILLL